jgi:hypothetical protein
MPKKPDDYRSLYDNRSQRLQPKDVKSPHYRRPDSFHDHIEHQKPQNVENAHGPGYDNDVGKKWTRGYGTKPHFDHSANRPSMQENKGNTWTKQKSDAGKQDGERYGGGGIRSTHSFQRRSAPVEGGKSGNFKGSKR